MKKIAAFLAFTLTHFLLVTCFFVFQANFGDITKLMFHVETRIIVIGGDILFVLVSYGLNRIFLKNNRFFNWLFILFNLFFCTMPVLEIFPRIPFGYLYGFVYISNITCYIIAQSHAIYQYENTISKNIKFIMGLLISIAIISAGFVIKFHEDELKIKCMTTNNVETLLKECENTRRRFSEEDRYKVFLRGLHIFNNNKVAFILRDMQSKCESGDYCKEGEILIKTYYKQCTLQGDTQCFFDFIHLGNYLKYPPSDIEIEEVLHNEKLCTNLIAQGNDNSSDSKSYWYTLNQLFKKKCERIHK